MNYKMELRHLKYFVTAAETGHFGRAAERLHIVQSALSMQIRALEAELGVILFERSNRRVTLTSAGELFREEAERTLRQAEFAKEVAKRASRGEVGSIRVGYVEGAVLTGKLAKDINRFKSQYPAVVLSLEEMTPLRQLNAVAAGQLDVGYMPRYRHNLLYGANTQTGLTSSQVATWPWVIALSVGHPLSSETVIPFSAIKNETFIVYDDGLGQDGQLAALNALFNNTPFKQYRVNNVLSVIATVSAGIGVAMMPAILETVQLHNIIYRPIDTQGFQWDLLLMTREGELSPPLKNFIAISQIQDL